ASLLQNGEFVGIDKCDGVEFLAEDAMGWLAVVVEEVLGGHEIEVLDCPRVPVHVGQLSHGTRVQRGSARNRRLADVSGGRQWAGSEWVGEGLVGPASGSPPRTGSRVACLASTPDHCRLFRRRSGGTLFDRSEAQDSGSYPISRTS